MHFRCLDKSDGLIALGIGLLDPFAAGAYILAKALDGDSIYHTHTIDMHAVDDCFPGDHNCGPAGEYMDIEFNTVLYALGNGIHLRGTPKIGMDVKNNVFAHKLSQGGSLTPGAILQNETGLHASDNIFGKNTFNDRKTCDFDGDGIPDPLIATGATLWYSSSAMDGRWVFVGQSPACIDEISFGDFAGNTRCDVRARGQVFLNPASLLDQPLGNFGPVLGLPVPPNLSTTRAISSATDLECSREMRARAFFPIFSSVTVNEEGRLRVDPKRLPRRKRRGAGETA